MSENKIIMQQQFEEWARSQCMQLKKDGVVVTYAYERTDLAWQAWQAAWKISNDRSNKNEH